MAASFMENYKAKHQHPVNRWLHNFGIPMIVISLPLAIYNWRWGLGLFVVGWIFQFAGHLVEGNQPAFFKNPIYLLIGPLWFVRKALAAIGIGNKPAERKTTLQQR